MSPVECEPGVAETSGELVELGKSDTETSLNGQEASDAHRMIEDLGFELDQPAAI